MVEGVRANEQMREKIDDNQSSLPLLFRKDSSKLQLVGLIGFALSLSGTFSRKREVDVGVASAWQVFKLEGFFSNDDPQLVPAFTIGEPLTYQICIRITAVVFCLLAVREALRFPRHMAHSTFADTLRTILQIVGDILLVPFYATCSEVPQLGYQRTCRNLRILEQCPSLAHFSQAPLFRNNYLAFAALLWYDFYGVVALKSVVRREILRTADGGSVALDWWEEREEPVEAKKILFIGSTLIGDALNTAAREVCRHFTSRGWHCVVMVKRGCGLTMPNVQPRKGDNEGIQSTPWCLSGLEDFDLALSHVARTYPGLPICGLGLSTGAGQMRNYVNLAGTDSKLSAAVIVDAAPRWDDAIKSLDVRLPLFSKGLAEICKRTYRECGVNIADSVLRKSTDAKWEGAEPVLKGGYLEFVRDWMAPCHGFQQSEEGACEYMKSCEPADSAGCHVPVLELSTYKDSLTTPDMTSELQLLYLKSPHVITAVTREGTHMVRWTGWRNECWISRAGCEFLEAVLH